MVRNKPADKKKYRIKFFLNILSIDDGKIRDLLVYKISKGKLAIKKRGKWRRALMASNKKNRVKANGHRSIFVCCFLFFKK